MTRNRDFKHVTLNAGKGKRVGLRSVQDIDGKVCHNKERIEYELREHDEMNFSKVKESKAHKDKIHNNLNGDEIRDKIMQGTLDIEDCDYDDACEFVCLLKEEQMLK